MDCSNIANYAKERKRMCNYYSKQDCANCPFDIGKDRMFPECYNLKKIETKVRLVQDWSDKNPCETYTVRVMRYFEFDVEASDEEGAIDFVENMALDFNEGEWDIDAWKADR